MLAGWRVPQRPGMPSLAAVNEPMGAEPTDEEGPRAQSLEPHINGRFYARTVRASSKEGRMPALEFGP